MGVYIKLGRHRALWLEFQPAWSRQGFGTTEWQHERIIALPFFQIIYTPTQAVQSDR